MPMEQATQFTLNDTSVRVTADGERRLLWVLRSDLGLTGSKCGCGEGYCGACTVLVDGEPTHACQIPLKDVQGRNVVTIEGLAKNGTLHPVQQAFVEHDALQCGFCTPGMIMRAVALLQTNVTPNRSEILAAMEQNLCRCGAHPRIVAAIESAARRLREGVTR
jgi:aerobic-type carbon monoxide dehydrogenase small subunit (CoxS/CutS family)